MDDASTTSALTGHANEYASGADESSSPEPPPSKLRRHGLKTVPTLLLSSTDLSISVIDPLESFEALLAEDQLRVYHLYRAVCETRKIAFLQSSAESPTILLLFQELFHSPLEQTLSAGEVIADLQKLCHSKNLSEAIVKFLIYVALFYYNFGNYDLQTGGKILPELPQRDFKEIVQSSRAFTLNRSPQRLQKLLDDSLDAIYTPGSDSDSHQAGETLSSALSHPFYKEVTLEDAMMVDKTLRDHQVPTMNTRVQCRTDKTARAKVFTVFQAAATPCDSKTVAKASEDWVDEVNASPTFRGPSAGARVLQMQNRNQIHLIRGDYETMLTKMVEEIRNAVKTDTPSQDDTLAEGEEPLAQVQAPQLLEHIVQFFANGDVEAQRSAKQLWETQDIDFDPLSFFAGMFALPTSRDPLRSRGAVESFLAIRNPFYQMRTQLLLTEHLGELLESLPFSHLMNAEQYLQHVSVECVDLVLTGRRASVLKLQHSLQCCGRALGGGDSEGHDDGNGCKKHRVMLLTNCMGSYAAGLVAKEKAEMLGSFLSSTVRDFTHDEREKVKYFQFLCEDVLSPATMVILQAKDAMDTQFNLDRDQVVYLPPELGVMGDDNEDGDHDNANKSDAKDREQQHLLWKHSSFARKADRWFPPDKSYSAKFSPAIAVVLEECRKFVVGLHLSLQKRVQHLVLSDWNDSVSEPRSQQQYHFQSAHRFGMMYWAAELRDALLGLLFYSKQHFRWEDTKMQARFMVLQMLLYDGSSGSPERYVKTNDDVVELLASFDSATRNTNGINCSGTVLSMWLHFPVQDETSWVHKAKLRSRSWLQKIQWLQITGDVQMGNDLYQRFSQVSDLFLQYREFLLSKLAPPSPDAAKESTPTATSSATTSIKKAQAPSQQLHRQSLAASSVPFRRARDTQTKASALRNASSFAHETLWIPPILQLCGNSYSAKIPDERGAMATKPQPHLGNDLPTSQRVVMRVFKPDLAQAIEAAVLLVGVIGDDQQPSFSLTADE